MKMKGRQTQPPAGRSAARLTKETKHKEINSYAEREAELEADVEAIFSKWKRKNPDVGFYGQLDVVFRVNSHWIPVILQAVQLAYNPRHGGCGGGGGRGGLVGMMRPFLTVWARAMLVHALRDAAERFEDSAVALERLLAQALAAQFRRHAGDAVRWRSESLRPIRAHR